MPENTQEQSGMPPDDLTEISTLQEEQPREEEFVPTKEDEIFINTKAKEYRIQGSSDEESIRLATEDCKKLKVAEANATDALWNEVTKKINLADFLDDQIRRALGAYKSEYMKKYPDFTLDFKLRMWNEKGAGGRLIAAANLELSFALNGNWKVWMNKRIKFTHIREINKAHEWKLALYEAMMKDLIGWGATYCLHIDAVKTQNIKAHEQPDATK